MEQQQQAPNTYNLMKWDGRLRPFFESWHVFANQPGSQAAFRLVYSVSVPRSGIAQGTVSFTSTVEGRTGANIAAAAVYALEDPRSSVPPVLIEMGPCSIETARSKGMMDAAGTPVTWDLVYQPVTDPLLYFPESFYRARSVPFKMVSPHPFLALGGKIQIQDHQFILNDDNGLQQHIWGTRHPREWTWFHCSSFANENGETIPAYATGLIARQSFVGAVLLPPRSFGHLVWNERHVPLQPLGSWQDRWRDNWTWHGTMGDESVTVRVRLPWSETVVSELRDSRGPRVYCHSSDVADCVVQFRVPRRPVREFVSLHRAHVEIGSQRLDARARRRMSMTNQGRR